jgi:anhydro-N-acetylmuramic acid kinase
MRYDVDGKLAREGTVIEEVVDSVLADPYFAAPPPKSTGRELFTHEYIQAFIDRCRAARRPLTLNDVIATAVQFTARSIAHAYDRFVHEPVHDVIVSGGGAKNLTLMSALAKRLAPRNVVRFQDVFFDGEAKEAVAFALLGYLHLSGAPGNIHAATGAAGPRILGKLTPV